ncbi:PREDICTED: triggering receptor expressed on myeloid cells 1 [Propithecus coquereli]|uniref:Triggering receptor expressed on myeloid cells 1 n=1 Tax=Propithecus coquereli TaxID=379532 RepID=A0A2K6EEH2_PROCO|nr:PREDICTED: triggering receptor expressed on myeloid cells 1 [Propithecus coquereli]
MRRAWLRGLLWVLLVSERQAAAESSHVEQYKRAEGETLEVKCPFGSDKYAYSKKAWQRLIDGGEPLTLALIEKPSGKPIQVQAGRITLEEIPDDFLLHVQMTNLQAEDSGLYQCVVYHPPVVPKMLFYPVRLVVTKGITASSKNPTQNLPEITTVPLTTTKALSLPYTSSSTMTQAPFSSTAVVSTPGPGINLQNVTNVTRVSVFSIVVPVACGLLTKSLVFTVLLAVTQKSF